MTRTGSVRWSAPQLFWTADGVRKPIANLPGPGLGGAWLVDHYVAYQHGRSEENWGDWELYLWDSVTGARPRKLDESDGQVPNAPFLLVSTGDRALVWLHPLKDGRREVRLHDVTTGKTQVVHAGHVGAPLIAGKALMWPEALAPDAAPRLQAVDLETLKPISLPAQIADVQDPQEMSSDGRTFAWASDDRSRLMAWRQGWAAPRVVVAAQGSPITWPRVSGDTVTWVADRTFTADLRSGSFAPMTRQWGSAEVWGPYLHIGVSKGSGSSYHLATAALPPLSGCP